MSITGIFNTQNNIALPLEVSSNGASVRVASLASGVISTLTTSLTGAVAWTISGNPSWVTLTPNPTNSQQAVLSFSNAQAQSAPYQFYVTSVGPTGALYYPFSLEVRAPFSLAASSGLSEFSIPSNDSSQADILIQGIGLGGTSLTDVQFLTPTSVPPGMSLITSGGSSLLLRVADSSSSDISGGLVLNTGSPESVQLTISAYNPGSMYDTPQRCFTKIFTIDSLTQKFGSLDVGLAVSFNTTSNVFQVNSYVDFLQGAASPVTYEWDVVGGAGSISSGGGTSDNFLVWTPSSTGTVTFTFKVKDPGTGTILAQETVSSIPYATGSSWASTAAAKFSVDAQVHTGYVGSSVPITISSPASEFNSGEIFTVTVSATAANGEATLILDASTFTLTEGSNSYTLHATIPPSGWKAKWNVLVSAANATSSPTRTGHAQVVVESNALPPLTVTTATTLSSSSGSLLSPSGVVITDTSSFPVVATLELVNAPDGLYIENQSVAGKPITPGTYTFQVAATASGYQRSYSNPIVLTVANVLAPATINSLASSLASLPDGQPFNVQWSVAGAVSDLTLYQNFSQQGVTGSYQVTTSQIGNSVLSLVAESFYGPAYGIPILVLSSSITGLGNLLDAPTVGTIDENQNLTLNWNPPTVDGSYSVYKGWNIYLTQIPGGSPVLQTLPTGIPTGLEVSGSTLSSRIFQTVVKPGDYKVSMQALSANYTSALDALGWDFSHQFPTALTASSFTYDNSTLELGQTLNITLSADYVGATSWRVVFPDNTTSGWLPLLIRTVSKIFTTPGVQNIIVQTRSDFSSSNPSVQLQRQFTQPVFVANQQYSSPNASTSYLGTEGFGGNSLFEITNNENGSVAPQPYLVVTRSLVRDTVTNEIRLLVATARSTDASSIYGTMALDVFPLQGRPRVKDLISIPDVLATNSVVSTNPVSIATTSLPQMIVGKTMNEFAMQEVSSSGTAPFSWFSEDLPSGVNMSIDGTITGTPQYLYTGSVRFSVMDSSNPPFIDEVLLPIVVASDLDIVTTTIPGAIVTTPYVFQVINTGGIAPFSWSVVSGALPMGLSIDSNTGIIVGVPVTYNSTTDYGKIYSATLQVVDSIGALASVVVSTSLSPAPLQFGNLDQPQIFAEADYRMVVPLFGGVAPYALSSFTDDGIVGAGLALTNPTQVHAVAGVASTQLTISTPSTQFYPSTLPMGIELNLAATEGVAPYRFSVNPTSNNTLPGVIVYGDTLVGYPTANGVFTVTIDCIDAVGHAVSKQLLITVQQKNSGAYTIQPVSVEQNGSTNPANWTVNLTVNLPDATAGVAYSPSAGVLYGLALYENGVLHMTQNTGLDTPMSFAIRSGSLPPNITTNSGNGYGASGDYSGIILFNAFGGPFPNVPGSYAFDAEFANIQTTNGAITQAVVHASITVTPTATGTATPVVIQGGASEITLNAANVSGSAYSWFLPLSAQGGSGTYYFTLQSSSTLPGAAIVSQSGVPSLTANNLGSGSYLVNVIATDSNGVVSSVHAITVTVATLPTGSVNIIATNLPSYVYANQATPTGDFYLEADEVSTWSAAGLPTGMTLTGVAGKIVYLQGTPTVTGTFTYTITAISTLYGAVTTSTFTLTVKPQSAIILNKPNAATVGVQYSVANNNPILSVQYVGYQPGSSNLPLLTSATGVVGSPSIFVNGVPTTQISSVTSDGFVMAYNYANSTTGIDTVTLGSGLDSCTIAISQPALIVTPQVTDMTVSEYATSATLQAPAVVSGGLAPYTVVCQAFSDSRFTSLGSGISFNPSQFTSGASYTCSVLVTATDSSGQVSSATGTLNITVRHETYIAVTFANQLWNVNVSSGTAFTSSILPSLAGSIPALGHAPYQYYVTNVTLPTGLGTFVKVSPSNRVLAIQFNDSNTSGVVGDVSPTLTQLGTFNVEAVNSSTAPAPGTYVIAVTLEVVDSDAIALSQTVNVNLVIS
jgi:hypothetical protein